MAQQADPTPDELREAIARGRSALRQAIEVVSGAAWERAHPPAPGETESWSPRQAAEHAIAADVSFARRVARLAGFADVERYNPPLPTPQSALDAIAEAAAIADPIFAQVRTEHLPIESEFADHLAGVMQVAGGHLREHARQIAGVS